MKINLLSFISVCFANVLFAQVGIGTENPKATLDVYGLPEESSSIDGIIAPRLTGVQLKAKDAVYTIDQKGALVYVTEGLLPIDVSIKTVSVTSPGYFYFDGAIWHRVSTDNIWVRQNSDKEVALVMPNAKYAVTYSDDRGYRMLDRENAKVETYNVSKKIYDLDLPSDKSALNITRTLVKDIPVTSNTNSAYYIDNIRTANFLQAIVGENDNFSKTSTNIYAFHSQAISTEKSTSEVDGLTGGVLSARHNGSGKASQVRGGYLEGVAYPNANAEFVRGAAIRGGTYSKNKINYLYGAEIVGVYSNSGEIANFNGISSNAIGLSQYAPNGSVTSNIDNFTNIRAASSTDDKVTGTINNYKGVSIEHNFNVNTPIVNAYGLKINNMPTHSTGDNYSIYTGTGKVFLGDDLDVKGTTRIRTINAAASSTNNILVADADGVVKTISPMQLSTAPQYFYAPSIVLPTTSFGVSTVNTDDIYYNSTNGTYTVKLHTIYQKQFTMIGDVAGASRTAIRSNSTSSLKTFTSTELDYFITYFDNTVFDPATITLSTEGVLTYKVIANSDISEKTFMNIVFKVK